MPPRNDASMISWTVSAGSASQKPPARPNPSENCQHPSPMGESSMSDCPSLRSFTSVPPRGPAERVLAGYLRAGSSGPWGSSSPVSRKDRHLDVLGVEHRALTTRHALAGEYLAGGG